MGSLTKATWQRALFPITLSENRAGRASNIMNHAHNCPRKQFRGEPFTFLHFDKRYEIEHDRTMCQTLADCKPSVPPSVPFRSPCGPLWAPLKGVLKRAEVFGKGKNCRERNVETFGPLRSPFGPLSVPSWSFPQYKSEKTRSYPVWGII